MKPECAGPFGSIEGAHEYLALLADVVQQSQQDLRSDAEAGYVQLSARRADALRLVAYNLEKLSRHLKSSRRILNDLRMLRRILQSDKATAAPNADATTAVSDLAAELDEHIETYAAEGI